MPLECDPCPTTEQESDNAQPGVLMPNQVSYQTLMHDAEV